MSLRLRPCPRLCQRLLAVSQPTPLPNCHRVQAADAVRVVHLGAEAAHIRPHDDPTTGHVWDSDREWPKWMVVVVSSPLPSLSASSTSSLSVSLPDPCCQSPLATTSLSPAAVRTPTHCRYQPRVRPAAASHDCQGTAAGRHQHDASVQSLGTVHSVCGVVCQAVPGCARQAAHHHAVYQAVDTVRVASFGQPDQHTRGRSARRQQSCRPACGRAWRRLPRSTTLANADMHTHHTRHSLTQASIAHTSGPLASTPTLSPQSPRVNEHSARPARSTRSLPAATH